MNVMIGIPKDINILPKFEVSHSENDFGFLVSSIAVIGYLPLAGVQTTKNLVCR